MTNQYSLTGQSLWLYMLLGAAVLLEVTGDLLFRKWGIENRWPVFAASLVVYNLGAVAWGFSLRHIQVSTGIVLIGVLNVVLVALGGVVLFQERLSTGQIFGIVLGIGSLVLLGGDQ